MSGDLDFEPVRGLPGHLPPGERLLWQGAPAFAATALRVFHVRKVAIYFALLVAWRLEIVLSGGGTLAAALNSTLMLVGLGAAAVAILSAFAWLVCRTSVYSITSRRVVMRIGVALPITFNLPFSVVESAALKGNRDGTGTISLLLTKPNQLSYLVLWPHARPWRLGRTEPSLRMIPDAAGVAQILSQAVVAAASDPDKVQVAIAAGSASAQTGQTPSWPLAPAAV